MYAKLIIKRFEASMTVEHDENKQSRMKGLTRGQEREHEHEYEYENTMIEVCEMQENELHIRC